MSVSSKAKTTATSGFLILALLLMMAGPSSQLLASGGFLSNWSAAYPASASGDNGSCQLCHGLSTRNLNEYGLDMQNQLDLGLTVSQAIVAIEAMNSDSDPGGFSNIEEINADAQPGWTPGVNTVYDRGSGAPSQETAPGFIGALDPVATTPDIDVAPLTLDFGAVTTGMSDARIATISNLGSGELTVTALSIAGSPDFAVGPTTPATPFAVPAGSSVDVVIDYAPSDAGGDSGSLEISSDDPDEPSVMVSLTGAGVPPVAPCDIDVNPLSLDFGSEEVGVTKTLTTSIGNTGGSPCEVVSLNVSGADFSLSPSVPALPIVVQAGLPVDVAIDYTPSDAGADTGMLSVGSDDIDEPTVVVALNGTGAPPPTCDIDVAPLTLDFGSVSVGSMMTRSAEISNIGAGACTVDSLPVSGTGFAAGAGSPPTPFTLLPQDSVTASVNFGPSAEGVSNGTLAVGSDDPAEPIVNVTLTGTGAVPTGPCDIQVDPLGLDFGAVAVGSSKAAQAALSNQGAGDCSVSSLSVSGSTDFALGGAAPAAPFTIPAGASAMIPVVYTPSDTGDDAGTLDIASDDPDSPMLAVNLTGSGAPPPPCDIDVSPLTIDFGAVAIGMTANAMTAATNAGESDCTVHSLELSGSEDFAIGSMAPTLPATLVPGEAVDIPVDYTPSDSGDDAGSLQIGSDDPDESSVAVSLTGTGIPPVSECDITVSPLLLDFGPVAVGMVMTQTTVVGNSGSAECTVNWQPSPGSSPDFLLSPAGTMPPAAIAPGDTLMVSVDYAPSDIGDDSGALDFSSNDPDEPMVSVSLAGAGFGQDNRADLDIAKLNTPREFRYEGGAVETNNKGKRNGQKKDQGKANSKDKLKGRRIEIKLLVENSGSSAQSRPAMLVGVQNGAEVYNQTIMVHAPADGGRKTFKFPPFVPTEAGDIYWTVTINDDSPDDDMATAVTTVR